MAGKKARKHGQGSIWQEPRANGNKVWVGQVRVGGRQYQRALGLVNSRRGGDGLTVAMAERALVEVRAQIEAKARDQRDASPALRSTALLSQVAERHFAYLENVLGRKARTVEDYRSMLNVHLVDYFGDVDVSTITRAHVEDFMSDLVARGKAHGTMLNVVNLLHAILAQAVRDDLVATNAAAHARRPRAARANKNIKYLTPEEVEAVIRSCAEDDLGRLTKVIVFTAAWTGLRQGELLALRWKNVDFVNRNIRVHESFSDGYLTSPKSFSSIRTVPLIEPVAQRLAALSHREYWTDDEDLVFGHPHKGTHMSAQVVIDRFAAAMKNAGLGARLGRQNGITFHSLRHTFGTQMATAGRPIMQVQRWMGHANQQTTEIYAQFAPDPTGGVDLAEQAYYAAVARDNGAVSHLIEVATS